MKIDLTIVGGSRPDLLERTLKSFNEKMFLNFEIGTVFVNLDPFGGNEVDRSACIDIINYYFINPQISCPENNSFGLAVKNLWSKPKSQVFFHLEDDWESNIVITPNMLKALNRKPVVQLAPPPFDSRLSIEVSKVNLVMELVVGAKYQIESSVDLVSWKPIGPLFIAQQQRVVQEFYVAIDGRYFRINYVP